MDKKKRGRKKKSDSEGNFVDEVDFEKTKIKNGEKVSFGGIDIFISKETETTTNTMTPTGSDECEIEIEPEIITKPITLKKHQIARHFIDNDKVTYVLKEWHGKTEKTLPEKSKYLCWWCCHHFNEAPKFLPTAAENGRFKVIGNFCSFNCIVSYIKEQNINSKPFHEMIQKIYGIAVEIIPAPPRMALKAFGGTMDIEDFRKNTDIFEINKPNIIFDHDLYLYKLSRRV